MELIFPLFLLVSTISMLTDSEEEQLLNSALRYSLTLTHWIVLSRGELQRDKFVLIYLSGKISPLEIKDFCILFFFLSADN